MKKFRLLALVLGATLVMTLGLTGCGNKDEDKDKDTTSNSSSVSDDDSSDGVVDDIISGTESDIEDFASDTQSDVDDMIDDGKDMLEDDKDKLEDDKNAMEDDASNPSNTADSVIANTDIATVEKIDNTPYGWGQGVDVDDANRPTSCNTYQEKYGKYDTYFIKENTDTMYLTFDEGYENGYTSQILDTLKQKDVQAVFFVTMPYVKSNPDLIQRMIDEGHVVGNHSVNHLSMPSLSVENAEKELLELHDYMVDNFDYTMSLFRPPMGEWSERVLAITKSLHYKTVLWSMAYKDWEVDSQPNPADSLTKLTDASHNGAIYLLHAVSETNSNILGDFIDNMKSKGMKFSTQI